MDAGRWSIGETFSARNLCIPPARWYLGSPVSPVRSWWGKMSMVPCAHHSAMYLPPDWWENYSNRLIQAVIFSFLTSSQNAFLHNRSIDFPVRIKLPHTASIIGQLVKRITGFIEPHSQSAICNVTDFAQVWWTHIVIVTVAAFLVSSAVGFVHPACFWLICFIYRDILIEIEKRVEDKNYLRRVLTKFSPWIGCVVFVWLGADVLPQILLHTNWTTTNNSNGIKYSAYLTMTDSWRNQMINDKSMVARPSLLLP